MQHEGDIKNKIANPKSDTPIPFFNREIILIIRGIALVMMFIHHFFTFPEWWGDSINYPLIAVLANVFRKPFRMCVPVFCFLTGYLYEFQPKKTYKYSLRKITDVLIKYWSVFLPLCAIAAFALNYRYTLIGFFSEMFAFSLCYPTMVFCWYVIFYIISMLLLPIFCKTQLRNIHFDLFLSIIITPVLMKVVLHYVPFLSLRAIIQNLMDCFPVTLVGMMFARYRLFERYQRIATKLHLQKYIRVFLCVLFAILACLGRWVFSGLTVVMPVFPLIQKSMSFDISLDSIYSPVFLYTVSNLCSTRRIPFMHSILEKIGRLSSLMWFLSCSFFGNCQKLFKPVLYFPRNPILVLLWGILICFVGAFLLDKIDDMVINAKNNLLFD